MKQPLFSKSTINNPPPNTKPPLKNILFLHKSLGTGGAEQLRYMLLKNLDKKRYNIKLCCIDKRGEFGIKLQQLGYQVDELGLNHNPTAFLTTLKLIKYFKKQKIDILHTCLFNANYHGRIAALICKIPYLITEEHGEPYEYNGIKFIPYIVIDYFLAKITDYIICCAKSSTNDFVKKERLPAQKVITITNSINPEKYHVTVSREIIRKQKNITEELVFVTVASLSRLKGHMYLINAFANIQAMGYSFKYFLIGDGPLRKTILDHCCQLGIDKNVIPLGRVDDVSNYLGASDVFILPSISEALSIALLEAMFMGLPCIATDVGANRELLEGDDNINQMIVPPQNEQLLQEAILFCLQKKNKDILKNIGIRNRRLIKEKYLFTDKHMSKYYSIWDNKPKD